MDIMAVDKHYITALNMLGESVRSLKSALVPPPKVFNNSSLYHGIEDFFYFFEKYCVVTYGEDRSSWLQVLPYFLAGQAKSIIISFGISRFLENSNIKARLIKELNLRNIDDACYTRYLGTVRKKGETLVCYCIRLEALANHIPNLDPSGMEPLVHVNLLKSLPSYLINNLNIQFRDLSSVTNEILVRTASILENQLGKKKPQMVNYANCEVPLHPRKTLSFKCFRCGLVGDIKHNCRVSLEKQVASEMHMGFTGSFHAGTI